jgi:hypothetical protein
MTGRFEPVLERLSNQQEWASHGAPNLDRAETPQWPDLTPFERAATQRPRNRFRVEARDADARANNFTTPTFSSISGPLLRSVRSAS